jgi:hypothetical protein
LLRDPFDKVVVVRILVAVVPFRLGRSPWLRDYVNIAVCDEAARVTGLYGTEPERRVSRLWRQYVRDVWTLNVLVMQGRGVKYGILARLVRSIDVHRQSRAISHGDTDVALLDHRFVSTRFRGADHRRNSAPVSTNRHPHRTIGLCHITLRS